MMCATATSRQGCRWTEATALRETDPGRVRPRGRWQSMATHVETMLDWQAKGAIVFDYGNNLRQRAFDAGVKEAFAYPGFVPAYIRPLFCEGKGPFRWVALSGDPADIYATDRAILELFPDERALCALDHAWRSEQIAFQGCPRASAGSATASGSKRAALQRDGGATARSKRPSSSGATTSTAARSPARTARPRPCGRLRRHRRLAAAQRAGERGPARRGSASITAAAWASATASTRARSSWPTGDAGCRAASAPRRRGERVLTNDPGMGVLRHVDAGYQGLSTDIRTAIRQYAWLGVMAGTEQISGCIEGKNFLRIFI
jgi:urocanate hydratase